MSYYFVMNTGLHHSMLLLMRVMYSGACALQDTQTMGFVPSVYGLLMRIGQVTMVLALITECVL